MAMEEERVLSKMSCVRMGTTSDRRERQRVVTGDDNPLTLHSYTTVTYLNDNVVIGYNNKRANLTNPNRAVRA